MSRGRDATQSTRNNRPAVHVPTRKDYTFAERLSDAVVHLVGLTLALPGVTALFAAAGGYEHGRDAKLGIAIYSASLILMLVASALYNVVSRPRWTPFLLRLDQSAIYVKIAGAHTPFLLLSGVPARQLLVLVWAAAAFGIWVRTFGGPSLRGLAIALYLAMGWCVALAPGGILAKLGSDVAAPLLMAGCLYTAGLIFFFWTQLRFHTAIWHGFVLAASMSVFVAVYRLLSTAGGL